MCVVCGTTSCQKTNFCNCVAGLLLGHVCQKTVMCATHQGVSKVNMPVQDDEAASYYVRWIRLSMPGDRGYVLMW